MKPVPIFITGGAGFIGANTAAHYLKLGHPVTVFDNLSRPGVDHNLDWLRSLAPTDQLTVITADVRDFNAVFQALPGHSLIFHFAGQTAVTTSIADPRSDFEVNALGTFNLLEAMRQRVPQAIFLYSSTNKVYGDLKGVQVEIGPQRYRFSKLQAIPEATPLDFYTPYGCSKGTGDQYVHDYARIYGLKTIVFRQSCIYGTHQYGLEDQGWVAHFVIQAIKHKPITLFGDGKQVRDLLYIDDLVQAFTLAIKHSNKTVGQIYNIGGGPQNTSSLLELIDQLRSLSKHSIQVAHAPPRQADQLVYISDIAKAKRDFNWQPHTSIAAGLDQTYQWLQTNLSLVP